MGTCWRKLEALQEKNMNTKPFYKSTAIQGGIIAILMFLVQLFGLDLDQGLITEFITVLLQLVGIVMTMIGRVKADTKLGWK